MASRSFHGVCRVVLVRGVVGARDEAVQAQAEAFHAHRVASAWRVRHRVLRRSGPSELADLRVPRGLERRSVLACRQALERGLLVLQVEVGGGLRVGFARVEVGAIERCGAQHGTGLGRGRLRTESLQRALELQQREGAAPRRAAPVGLGNLVGCGEGVGEEQRALRLGDLAAVDGRRDQVGGGGLHRRGGRGLGARTGKGDGHRHDRQDHRQSQRTTAMRQGTNGCGQRSLLVGTGGGQRPAHGTGSRGGA